jgi:hypothetical protein
MAKLLTFEALGYRDVAGRMARRSTELVQAQRDEMRELGRAGVSTIRHYAPEDTGKFKAGIRYRTTDTGKGTTLAFYASGEHAYLLPFLTEGTPPHEIPAALGRRIWRGSLCLECVPSGHVTRPVYGTSNGRSLAADVSSGIENSPARSVA